jgi:hypothetical protein
MTTEHQEYQTQVYHVPSMTLQKEFQYPDSPAASSSRAVISPAGSPNSTMQNINIASVISTSYDGDEEYIDSLKSSTDVYRERGANLRALALLDVEVAGVEPYDKPKPGSAMTARKAAILNYEQQQKEKSALKLKSEMETFAKRAPVLVAPSRKNKLAETTRKVKKPSEEDFGIDNIADMKSQLDLDREQQAMHKALRLLNDGFMH